MKRIISLSLLLACSLAVAKEVLILTPVFNKPEFIGWQKQLFDKFVTDEDGYRMVAFDDSIDPAMTQRMQDECKKWDVQYVRIPQEIHTRPYLPRHPKWPKTSTSLRVSDAYQYMADTMGFDHDGIVFFTDSDQFLTRPFNFHEATENYDMIAVLLEAAPGIRYVWQGMTICRMDRLPDRRTINFNCGHINGAIVDSGGFTYYYFQAHPEVRVKQAEVRCASTLFLHNRFAHRQNTGVPIDEQLRKLKEFGFDYLEIGFLQQKPNDVSYSLNNTFLHYNAGSNYDHQSKEYITKKDAQLREYFQAKLCA